MCAMLSAPQWAWGERGCALHAVFFPGLFLSHDHTKRKVPGLAQKLIGKELISMATTGDIFGGGVT